MQNSSIRYHRNLSSTNRTGSLVRIASLCFCILFFGVSMKADEIDVWIGTGTTEQFQAGIYHLKLDTEKGTMSEPRSVSLTAGAGFLAMHPNGKVLYSTDSEGGGGVSAYSIGWREALVELRNEKEKELNELSRKLGEGHPRVKKIAEEIEELEGLQNSPANLKFLNHLETGDGGAACVAVDKTGKVLMSAQYGGGSVSSYTILPDGSLGERVEKIEHGEGSEVDPRRQEAAHPHWVGTSPDNRFLMVPDLGLDRVVVYELDAETAKLKPHARIEVSPGSGPRHMKFHTSGKYAYVLNELKLTVSVFEYDAETAAFKEIQLIETLPEDRKGKNSDSAAEVRVHPSGRFVYTSNRGHDSITVFSVDEATGKLALVEQEPIRGAWPRNFNLDPSGKWLIAAGQQTDSLTLFEVNQETGELTFARKAVNVPEPICVLFQPE